MRVHLVNPSDISFGVAVITPRWLYVLAAATPEQVGNILASAGGSFASHDPGTWPQQAQMAAEGQWTGSGFPQVCDARQSRDRHDLPAGLQGQPDDDSPRRLSSCVAA